MTPGDAPAATWALDAVVTPVPPEVLVSAEERGVLVGRLGLTDPKGNPLCASVRSPLIKWWAAAV